LLGTGALAVVSYGQNGQRVSNCGSRLRQAARNSRAERADRAGGGASALAGGLIRDLAS
jgi:hypothetical protein